MQRCLLHQLEGGGIDLAVLEIHRLVELLLLPLCNLQREGWQDTKTSALWIFKLIFVCFLLVGVSPLMGSCNLPPQSSPKRQNGVRHTLSLYTHTKAYIHKVRLYTKTPLCTLNIHSVPSHTHHPGSCLFVGVSIMCKESLMSWVSEGRVLFMGQTTHRENYTDNTNNHNH